MIDFVGLIPADQEGIRSMVLHRMSRAWPHREVAGLGRYIRDEWDRTARTPEYRRKLVEWTDGGYPSPSPEDLARALASRIGAAEPALMESLVSDTTLHPCHRLYWVFQARNDIAYDEGIADAASRALEVIRAESGSDASLANAIDRIEAAIEERRAFRAYHRAGRLPAR
jgi:hypothetical protein